MTTPYAVLLAFSLTATACRDGGGTTLDASATADAPADTPAGDLIGTWIVTTFQGGPAADNDTWTFTTSAVTVIASGLTFNGTYTINPTATPQQIDISLPGAVPDPNLAIYRFDSATSLILKLQNTAGPRATTFDVDADYDLLGLTKQ